MMQFPTTLKYQRETDGEWSEHVRRLPGCERLHSCIQCGTCSGTCPLSIYMDYTPRKVVALVREGFKNEALSCRTIWLCASCYSCAVHCPQQIHLTDMMYSLKREAIRERRYPKRFPIPVLAREFYHIVKSRGRNSEMWLVLRLALKSNPLILFDMVRSGLGLLRTGRISLKTERIKAVAELQNAVAVANGKGEA